MNKFINVLLLVSASVFLPAAQYNANFLINIPNTLAFDGRKFTGALAPFLKCITKNAKIDTQFEGANIDTTLDNLATGKIDYAIAMVKSADRDQYAIASLPVLTLDAILLSDKAIQDGDLLGEIVAIARGSSYSKQLETQGARLKVANSYQAAVQMLIDRKATAALIPRAVLISNDFADVNQYFNQVFTRDTIVFYVSKKTKDPTLLVAALNRGINICRAK